MEGSVSGLIIGPLNAQSSILRFMMPFQFDLCVDLTRQGSLLEICSVLFVTELRVPKTFSDFIQLILLTWIIIIQGQGISEPETQDNDNKDRW